MLNKRTFSVAALSVLAGTAMWAQGRNIGPEWQAAGADAQRTSWQRTDPNINADSVSKPGFELQWTSKLDNQPRHLNAISEAVTVNGIGLFWPVSLVTGSSNMLFEIDNDTGNVQWSRKFDGTLPAPTAACPGGLGAAPARVLTAPPAPAPPRAGGGGARGGGYRSAVGAPGEGVPVELAQRAGGGGRGAAPAGAPGAAPAAGAAAAGAPPATPPAGAPAAAAPAGAPPAGAPARGTVAPGAPGAGAAPLPGRPGGGGGGGLGRVAGPGYVVAADGMLHVIGWQEGKDIQKPAPFLPPNARFSDPIVVNNVLYTATSGNCGGAPDGIWAIDLASEAKPVASLKTAGRPIGDVALTTDGRVVAAIGRPAAAGRGGAPAASPGTANAIVILDPKTLELKDWFSDPAMELATQPVIFRHNDRDIIAAATANGRIVLLDAASPGGANHATPLFASGSLGAGVGEAMATWQEMTPPATAEAQPVLGTRWLLMPASASIVAVKVVDQAGKPVVQPGWTSRDMPAPTVPVIVNGVVFAAASGRPSVTGNVSTAEIARRGTPATLYALDGVSGRELWNSGKTITSFVPGRSLWGANSQIHVATYDGTVYAFGFALERK